MKFIKLKKRYIVLLSVAVFLIVLRVLLPYFVLRYANAKVSEIKGYYGHIDDIDLSLIRGAYIIRSMYLNKIDKESLKQIPFFKCAKIDLSIRWKPLFNGKLVGKMELDSPIIVFTRNKVEIGDIKKDTSDLRKLFNALMPLKVDRFEGNNGAIHYIDNGSSPKVDISLKQAHILALNLTNVTNSKVELPSDVFAEASMYGGKLNLNMKLNPMAVLTTFDLKAEIKNINLASLNDLLKAYGHFDVNKGTMGLYMEMATRDGKFMGYVKPVIKDLDVIGPEDKNDSFFQKIWESVISVAGVILKNQSKDQVATKIRLEGNYHDPKTNTLDAVWEILRNAFIRALIPSVENAINLNSVKDEREVAKLTPVSKGSPHSKKSVKNKK